MSGTGRPITAASRLTLLYTPFERQRKSRYYCTVVADGDQPSGFAVVGSDGSHLDLATWAEAIFTAAKPMFKASTASFDGWVAENYVSGEYVFVAQGSVSITPTGSTVNYEGMSAISVFKDTANKVWKWEWSEGEFDRPNRFTSLASGSIFDTLNNALLDQSTGGVGLYVQSRAGLPLVRFIATTMASNRKIRRQRGIA